MSAEVRPWRTDSIWSPWGQNKRRCPLTLAERAQKVRQELFERYDKINALYLQFEERLNRKYHIPHPIQHSYYTYDLEEGNPNAGWASDCLGLDRIKGKWRICHGSYYYAEDGPR